MTSSPHSRIRLPALAVLGGLALSTSAGSTSAMAGPTMTAPFDAVPPSGTIQPANMGDLPTVPQRQRRGGGRRAKGKDKPYQPLAKDVQGESADAHKEYLKRNGF